MIMSEVVLSQKTYLWAAVVLNSRPIGVRMLCSYVALLSKGKGTDGELYLQAFLSHASLMTTALSLESLRLAAAVSFCLHNTSDSACMPDITHVYDVMYNVRVVHASATGNFADLYTLAVLQLGMS